MKVKVFEFDKNNKVSFTKKELEDLLNEIYQAGYDDGRKNNYYWTWTSPSVTPLYNTISGNDFTVTCSNKADVEKNSQPPTSKTMTQDIYYGYTE